ncbi:hypothetical protein [Limisalsivibrio acetivorans]|uniref:hypothetical protein n=1 Tax=Limisalsivibrio acetivorans TaxID=1304888 RepID=UPI0003B5F1F1|nr:hypothetical protein [Limisalsivibrio acetivorans]
MEVMDIIKEGVNIGGNAIAGGIFGVIGAVFTGFLEYLTRKQKLEEKRLDHEHRMQMQDKEIEMYKLTREAADDEHEHELEIAASAASAAGMTLAYKDQMTAGKSYRWVEAVKTLFRPAVTLLLIAGTFYTLYSIVTCRAWVNVLSGSTVSAIAVTIVESNVFLAATAVGWWFGDRGMKHTKGGVR